LSQEGQPTSPSSGLPACHSGAALARQEASTVSRVRRDLAWSRYDVMGGTYMVNMLLDKLDAIRQSCKNHNVVRLDIFGSALREDFEPDRSDIDFLVDFGAMSPFDKPDAYFGLLNELRNILGTEVDLVMVGALKNRYIRDDINRTKQQLYAA